jgi:hypothetical protein
LLNFGGAPVRWPAELPGLDRAGGDRGTAAVELSTDPGRQPGAVRLDDLVVGPDEGLVVRLG